MKSPVGPALSFRVLLISSLLFVISASGEKLCPVGCECDLSKQKVKCSGGRWSELNLKDAAVFASMSGLQHLDLSKNKITRLESSFIQAPTLKRLNLSDNKIRSIAPKAFSGLSNLVTLDLSANNLHIISREVLTPLKALERLKLKSNQLTTLEENIFADLEHLKMLDLSENPWNCNCAMAWLANWIKTAGVKFQPPAKCQTPESRAGISLKRLEIQCLNELELTPSQDQVVFAGDSLALRCRGVGISDRVRWVWRDVDPQVRFTEVAVAERTLPEHGLVESSVRIERLEPEHSGDWVCQQVTGGNSSAAVSVLVLSESTRYCPGVMSRDNKGVYFWPRTVVGYDVELPCAGERVAAHPGIATYSCNSEGQWEDLNTSACTFISETTKILEQFARDNLTAARDPVIEKAKRLLNLTGAVETLTDPMDVVFVSQTVEMYSEHLASSEDLSSVLIDVISGLLRAPRELLVSAERIEKACSRLRSVLERIAEETSTFQAHRASLAVEEFAVTPDSFTGMACVWRLQSGTRQLHCSTSGRVVLDTPGRDLVAMVELPLSLFVGLELVVRQLVVSVFENANFFPDLVDADAGNHFSSVVGVNIAGLGGLNLTEPVAVMVRAEPGVAAQPVWWDALLHAGAGGWSDEGCLSSHMTRDLLLFHCHRLGYYTLRQGLSSVQSSGRSILGQAALYSGSCVLLVCLLMAMCTYLMCHGAVQMSRRAKHAVANTWLSIFLLCFLYSFGVLATEDVKICEGVGLALHYFSLSAMLWMAVAGNHMYKRQSRGALERPADDLPPGAPIHKPILGLYLVGWGVGLIVCGISGAVHLRDYAQPSFCFLGAGPALSAVLVPAAILVTVLCILFFLSLCAIRNNDVNGQLSEGTQGTENVDLELLEDGACAERTERRSARSEVTDSEDVEDPEHAPLIQLKAHVIVLALFLLLWAVAAMATTADVYPVIPHQEPIANCLYCLFAFCLGAFILYFYCVARSDVRARWSAWCRLLGTHRRCCRTRSISDTQASLPLQSAPPTVLCNRPPSVNSGMTGRSSSSHRTKAVLELNNCDSSDGVVMHCKPSNCVNLVAMHRQIYRSNNSMPTYHEIASQNCADAFYNPRQSIVAKKFFKKQRKNRRNELGMRRRGDGGGTSEGEASQARRTWRPSAESAVFLSSDMENNSEKLAPNIFGYGSKINNTNIHVGHSSRKKDNHSPKNPNVLSEEEDDKGGEKVLLARLVIGAEEEADSFAGPSNVFAASPGLGRVDEEAVSPVPDCRSVELQCSLGDSSDVPDGDDSFCQKIDSLRLASDESCADKPTTPPQYVTVLDPKYGVVKVTMSDYQQQSHRLSLASSPGDHSSDMQRRSLPSTPEEYLEPGQLGSEEISVESTSGEIENGQSEQCDGREPRIPPLPDLSAEQVEIVSPSGPSPSRSHHSLSPEKPRKPPKSLNLVPRNYISRRSKHSNRRSLPSSPESRDMHDVQCRSLPSSPECHAVSGEPAAACLDRPSHYVDYRRLSPRLTLPPPPDFPAPSLDEDTHVSSSAASIDLNDEGEHEQWQKPEPPTSPTAHHSVRRRPISENAMERNERKKPHRLSLSISPENSQDDSKKETSV